MDISKIQIGSGTYDIKDTTARNQLATINNYFLNKKFILIGDSYADGYTPDGNVTSWESLFVTLTGLTNTIQKHQGGAGFVNLGSNKNFQTLLEEVTSSDEITDIVVLGGYNDTSYTKSQIDNAINSFSLKAQEKFPNANIHIGFIGSSNIATKTYPLFVTYQNYSSCTSKYKCNYLSGIELCLHDYFHMFSSDGIHPNATGQNSIATYLIQALQNGSCNVCFPFTEIHFNYNNINEPAFGNNLTMILNNGMVVISLAIYKYLTFTTSFNLTAGINEIELGTITNRICNRNTIQQYTN